MTPSLTVVPRNSQPCLRPGCILPVSRTNNEWHFETIDGVITLRHGHSFASLEDADIDEEIEPYD